MSNGSEKSNEFRRYRKVLAALYFGVIAAGLSLLAVSVVKELFFRPPVQVDGPVLSADDPDPADLVRCHETVVALYDDLGRTFDELTRAPRAGTTPDVLDAWQAFSQDWLSRWDEANARCRFEELSETRMGPAYDVIAEVHEDLPVMRLKFQSLLVRFEEELAAELARTRQALATAGRILGVELADPGAARSEGEELPE